MAKTLFTVETERARLVWSGPACPVQDDRETLSVRAAPGATVRLDGQDDPERPLRIDEETTHGVWLESRDGSVVGLHHADPVVVAGLASARGGTVIYGTVRFGAQAGRSRFSVTAGGRPEALVEVTVSPAKASWADVEAMRARVEAAVLGAALALLRPAEEHLARAGGMSSPPAWLALLRAEAPRLGLALRSVARDALGETVRPLADVRPSALRRASGETARALRGVTVWPERVPGRLARVGFDTPAHRWLAARLDAVLHRASAVRAAEAARPDTQRRTAVLDELDRLTDLLGRARRSAPLRDASRAAPTVPPRQFGARPDYAAAADALAALGRTLALASGPVAVPMQDTSVLYETWAALETVRAFALAVGAEAPARPFGRDAAGLGPGAEHAVRLVGDRGEVEIVRAPRFAGPPALLVQIPDLLVTVRRPSQPAHVVVLDAKYRLDASGAAPPGDALGALHRYRDAIVGPDGRALVRTAAVLFPARPGAGFEASRIWSSLGRIGVGAVPLLPGATEWLDRLAARLVSGEPS
ncbi:MAG TPA: DUF2357 domain-containing protein [Rubricoccaceae bacterium]